MSLTVAILGGRGMLGMDLDLSLRTQGYQTQVYDLPECDITDGDRVRVILDDCDVVVNCAAYTNVDGAESEMEFARRINAEAVGQLGRLARNAACHVLHISTDFVFDGTLDRPYAETDTPNPLSAYGRSKWEGELELVESGCEHTIVRVQWTYGKHGIHFIKKLLDRARNQDVLKVVDDQIGSPTATVEVARILTQLVEKQVQGLYHCACSGYVSRFDMARFVIDTLGLEVTAQPCRTSDFASPAQRPLNSRFNCEKLTSLIGSPLPSWQESLEAYLEQL